MNNPNKPDCLLIHVPKLRSFYRLFGYHMCCMSMPMGLFSVADYNHRQGYATRILHLGLELISNPDFSLSEYLDNTEPKVVGLSLHWYYQAYDTIETARMIKSKKPEIFLVLGGMTASYYHREIMEKFDCIDAVIRGDGEIPFSKLSQEILTGHSNLYQIPNLTWREKDRIIVNDLSYVAQNRDLDDFNFTNFKLLRNFSLYRRLPNFFWVKGWGIRMNRILNGIWVNMFPLYISRGCAVNCSLCSGGKDAQEIISGRETVAIRSVSRVMESVRAIRAHGYDTLYINYSETLGGTYFHTLFDAIGREDLNMNCVLECWDFPPRDLIDQFKKTFHGRQGSVISISPESGSERVRKLNKGRFYTDRELQEVLQYLSVLKIPVILWFTLGLPFETFEDIKTTGALRDFLTGKFKNIVSVQVLTVGLEPGSPADRAPEKYDIIKMNASFEDFFNFTEGENLTTFSTPQGYLKRDLFSRRTGNNPQCESGQVIQKIKCRDFCILSNAVLCRLFRGKAYFLRKPMNLLSRLLCKSLSMYWRLTSGTKPGKAIVI